MITIHFAQCLVAFDSSKRFLLDYGSYIGNCGIMYSNDGLDNILVHAPFT